MSKTQRNKKLTRNLMICAITVLVIAALVFLIILTQQDGAGMNCFQRNATVASADGVKVTMSEYRLTYDMLAQSYSTATLTDEQVKTLQENAARQVLVQKIYAKEAKALGITLTDEQKEAARTSAQQQIDSVKEYYRDSLISSGTYSKTALDKQIAAYYERIGMTEGGYLAFLTESAEASYYSEAITAYYEENGNDFSEQELLDYYRETVEESMYTENEDGTKTANYSEGDYWYSLMLYSIGYSSPMLYVPEDFIYIDFIKIEKGSTEEVNEVIEKVNSGEMSFDELMASDENKDTYRGEIQSPYPIGKNDHAQLFSSDEIFEAAKALEVGSVGTFVEEPVEAEDGTVTVTAYLFRRATSDMCMDGETGVIKLDFYPEIRSSIENEYRFEKWLGDVRFEDALYAYKGALG